MPCARQERRPRSPGLIEPAKHAVLGACASAGDEAPDREHDDRTDDRADEACAFAGLVPADRLSEVGRNKRAHDPENGCQDKALVVGPGMMNFAITPAMKPMMIVQIISMRRPPNGRTAPAAPLRPSRPRSSFVLRKARPHRLHSRVTSSI